MNVDKSIRILEFVCCDEYNNLPHIEKEKIIKDFFNIENKYKPRSYRNLRLNEIRDIFSKLNFLLKQELKKDLNITGDFTITKSTDNNKKDSDALVTYLDENNNINKVNLEMKFGSETLANIGQNTMNTLFSFNNSNFSFYHLNKIIINYQRSLIDKGVVSEDELLKNLKIILEQMVNQIKINNIKPNKDEINKLLSTTGSRNKKSNKMIKYKIFPKEIKLEHIYETINDWKIDNISLPPNTARIQIILKNGKTKLKFLLNWKNNYIYPKKSGNKFSAKTGGTTSSWNVWIYIEE